MRRLVSILAFVVVIGGLIEVAMRLGHASPAAFARPSEVVGVLPEFAPGGRFAADVGWTALRGLGSFLIALPVGLLFGLSIAKAGILRPPLGATMDFLRSTPATALVPVFLLIFGPGTESKVAAGAFTGALSVALAVAVGIQNLDGDRRVVADLIGLKGFRRVFLYELPEALPAMFVGIRSAVSLAFILVIVAEMLIGSESGLGHVIMDMSYTDDVPAVYGAIVCSGALGYLANEAVSIVERALTRKLALETG